MDAKQRQRRIAPTQCYEARLMGFILLLDLKVSTWAFVGGKFVERAILSGDEVLKCEIDSEDRSIAERSEIRNRKMPKRAECLSMFAVQSSTTEMKVWKSKRESSLTPSTSRMDAGLIWRIEFVDWQSFANFTRYKSSSRVIEHSDGRRHHANVKFSM